MKLWLWYATGTEEQIAAACAAADAEIVRRGFTLREAFEASMEAADTAADFSAEASTPEAQALVAWYAGEAAAFETLTELTGTWPEQATLIGTE